MTRVMWIWVGGWLHEWRSERQNDRRTLRFKEHRRNRSSLAHRRQAGECLDRYKFSGYCRIIRKADFFFIEVL